MIIRRPHAYWFIQDHNQDRGGIRQATPTGVSLADGSSAPLPGVYVLDPEDRILASVNLLGGDAQAELLEALRAQR